MESAAPIDDVKAAAAAYKRTKAAHEKAQAALADAVVAALRAGERPADVSRASGWDREYNRRLKTKADERDNAAS
jgi:predicted RNA-binding protein associated with RNAse of E/G family